MTKIEFHNDCPHCGEHVPYHCETKEKIEQCHWYIMGRAIEKPHGGKQLCRGRSDSAHQNTFEEEFELIKAAAREWAKKDRQRTDYFKNDNLGEFEEYEGEAADRRLDDRGFNK